MNIFFSKKNELKFLLNKLDVLFRRKDEKYLKELLYNGEYLMVFEGIVNFLIDYDEKISTRTFDLIVLTGNKLKFQISEIELLEKLIKKEEEKYILKYDKKKMP